MSVAIEFRDVDIFFGQGRGRKRQAGLDRAIELAGQGLDRSEICNRTGVVLGVHGASLAQPSGVSRFAEWTFGAGRNAEALGLTGSAARPSP